ncbi:MAG TPA: glutamyl-tRNA reductase [Actinomycetota bacterium]|nr:glutamyl-tRNA reductase [Actinomycetota bacterium]
MALLTLGVSYRRAPIELLERLSFADDDLTKGYHHLSTLPSVREGVIVSTCNRVEVYAAVSAYHEGFKDLKRFLAEARDAEVDDLAEPLYSHYEDHAVEHLFSVAAGIDSMVVGEPQILQQVGAALKRARLEGTAGPVMDGLFRHAIRVGRRARSETAIGASPSAFVDAGSDLAAAHLGGLEGRSLLVVGAGKMSALAVRSLQARGIEGVRILNRTPARAQRLAAQTGAEAGSLDDLPGALGGADLIISSTASTAAVITRDLVREASPRRRFFLDLAVPRDVDPEVRSIPDQAVADIADLRAGLKALPPNEEVDRVRGLIAEEVRRHAVRRRAARLAPLIRALQDRGEEVRQAELRRLRSRLAGLSERDREAVEALTRGIVNKLLHDPLVRLKEPGRHDLGRAVADLFGLEPADDG